MGVMLAINVAALEVIYNPYEDINTGCIQAYSYDQAKEDCNCSDGEIYPYKYKDKIYDY